MAIASLPPGFRFHPTDVELVKYYLKRKVLGKRFPVEAIAEVDIYDFPPWDLQNHACLRNRDLKWYFFCPRKRKYATGSRTKRSTKYGFWKTTGRDRPILYNGRPVGMIKSLIFHRRSGQSESERTDWVLHEYRLEDEDLKTRGVAQDAFVLCMIYEKEGRGPRNGAQYGAPFNEEDWDDDEEADVLSASGFTREYILPVQQSHSVDVTIAEPDRYCVGSASEACMAGPSQIVPSAVNLPTPAPATDIAMEDPQNICDDCLRSNGIFCDDIPAASSENGKVENLDDTNPDGDHQDEVTMDDIFDNLEGLGDCSSLAPYRPANNFAVTDSDANVFPPSEPYMELNDFDAPLTALDGHGPSGHYSEGGLSTFDHLLATRWTSVISDDEKVSGLGLKDLETSLTCVGEAGRSNEANVDASFSDLGGNDGLGGSGSIPGPPGFAQPSHGLEVAHNADDFPWFNGSPQGYVDMHPEGYGVEERLDQEIVRYGAGAANSSIYNPNLGCAHACENPGRGRSRIW